MVLIETRTRMHDASNAPHEQRERERELNPGLHSLTQEANPQSNVGFKSDAVFTDHDSWTRITGEDVFNTNS